MMKMKLAYITCLKSILIGGFMMVAASANAELARSEMPMVSPDDYKDHIVLAEQGVSFSERIVGDCFLTGVGAKKDVNQAWRWYAKAAADGDNEARYRIACLYHEGYGVRQNDL